jgi:hypothetical protein
VIWSNLLCVAPVLLLVALALVRRYPGERLLVRLADRRRRRPARPRMARPVRYAHQIAAPRGGLLMGFSLAGRPPPLAPTAG